VKSVAAAYATLAVLVSPRASRERIQTLPGGTWKLHVTAPPVDGEANRAAIELLAKTLGIAKSAVTLESGASSRRKRFRIEGLSAGEIGRRLSATP